MNRSRREMLQEMLTDEPNDPELRYMLAMEYVSEGDDEAAVRGFEEIMRLFPQYPPAYHQAGQTLARLGRIEQARAVLHSGIPVAQQGGNYHAAGEMTELLDSLEG